MDLVWYQLNCLLTEVRGDDRFSMSTCQNMMVVRQMFQSVMTIISRVETGVCELCWTKGGQLLGSHVVFLVWWLRWNIKPPHHTTPGHMEMGRHISLVHERIPLKWSSNSNESHIFSPQFILSSRYCYNVRGTLTMQYEE